MSPVEVRTFEQFFNLYKVQGNCAFNFREVSRVELRIRNSGVV